MNDPRDDQYRKGELLDDDMVEEAAEEIEASNPESEQPMDDEMLESQVESSEEEQVNRQLATAGLTVDVDEGQVEHDSKDPRETPEQFDPEPLFKDAETEQLRERWLDVQSSFVDSPQASLESADQFIEQVLDTIRSNLSTRCQELQKQWNNGNGDITTEDLRQVIKHYRSMLDRLLEIEI